MEEKKIAIIVTDQVKIKENKYNRLDAIGDDYAIPEEKGLASKAVNKTVMIGVNAVKNNVNQACEAMMLALSEIDTSKSKFEIDEIVFNLVFDQTGSVKLLSVLEGEINSQTGITIKLKPK